VKIYYRNNLLRLIHFGAYIFVFLFFPSIVLATWSIGAVNPESGAVGIAGASCTYSVWGIAGIAPGKGVIAAQAMSNKKARNLGVRMLIEGSSPSEILIAITDYEFDPSFSTQQYGIVALGYENESRGFTGESVSNYKEDVQGYGASVQGNILVNMDVIIETMKAFENSLKNDQLSFADSLMAALEAGSTAGGDRRCGNI
jgi:uncharacterized Ntn-hydrolase superfamily protein